ncbi:MAG TPA: serine/threonine-protein kinase, partial [Polyangiaceae bacterium]|nr:serine/threonine-protein kinase [Polyangiaceae bacterium]
MPSRPEVERALLRAGSNPSQEEADRFYAQRVADYGRTIGAVFMGIYLVGAVSTPFAFPGLFWRVHLHPAKLFNLGVALGGLAIHFVARRPGVPGWLITVFDLGLPVGIPLAMALLSHTVPPIMAFYFFPLLVAALILIVRAAIVPSPASRTLLVGLVTMPPVVYAGYVLALKAGNGFPVPLYVVLAGIAVWCVAISAATTIVSSVIYGLHREIATARRLGQYVLGDLIGEGGMGAVYRAQHAMLRRPTAIKLLLPERAGPENIARFEREVQLTARLTHPNTVAVYDYGRTPDGVFYYAMEYLDGLSLEDLVRTHGPQPEGRVIHILVQAAGALLEAHALGLIHRDVKPANILLCERGGAPDMVKLLDFGLVKSLVPSQNPELTHADAITGTPQYLAPESILEPANVDARVDLYALGGVGYFLLTGRPAFEGKSVLEVCGHHLHSTPERPSERLGRTVLPELEALVLRC